MTLTATEPAPVSARRGHLAPLIGLGWDVGLPLVGYYALHLLGASDWTALLAGALAAGLRLVWVAVRDRRTTWFGALMLAVFGIGLLLALVGGDPRFVLVKDSFTTGGVGVVFLLSLLGRRPLTFSAYQSWQPTEAGELDGMWDTAPGVRRIFRVAAVVWGLGLIAEAAVRVPMIYALPVDVAVGASTGLQIAAFALLGVWNAVYVVRSRRRLEQASG